jgi:hypothetical protein
MPARASSRSSGRKAISRAATIMSCTARAQFRLAQSRQGIDRARSHSATDKTLFAAMLAKADVFVQNLKPGAIGKLGFPDRHAARSIRA